MTCWLSRDFRGKKFSFVFGFANSFSGQFGGIVATKFSINDSSAPLLLGYSARVVGGANHVIEVAGKATEVIAL